MRGGAIPAAGLIVMAISGVSRGDAEAAPPFRCPAPESDNGIRGGFVRLLGERPPLDAHFGSAGPERAELRYHWDKLQLYLHKHQIARPIGLSCFQIEAPPLETRVFVTLHAPGFKTNVSVLLHPRDLTRRSPHSHPAKRTRTELALHKAAVEVAEGDTASGLALRYAVPEESFKALPLIAGTTLHPPFLAAHVVAPGDSQSALAAQFGVPLKRLREANDLESPDLQVGSRLVIPGGYIKAQARLSPSDLGRLLRDRLFAGWSLHRLDDATLALRPPATGPDGQPAADGELLIHEIAGTWTLSAAKSPATAGRAVPGHVFAAMPRLEGVEIRQ